MIQLLVFLPLLAAVVAGLGNRLIGNTPAKLITTGALFASCFMAWPIFIGFLTGASHAYVAPVLTFIHSGDLKVDWALRVDSLTAVMLVVITSVSALVHLYSWGYMAEDPAQPRFFAYLSLFTFAMLMLVTAADFMQLFFGWEGVGLASYLLIGFWFKKPTANAASIKAFVTNRVGDFGFALGIMTIFWMFHTIRFAELFPLIAAKAGTSWTFAGFSWSALDIAGFLLFIGAAGKSAQFFLHVWLPDAMEGPTPVSALIHAATMVTAGVYMLCLLSPLYEYAPVAREIITVIGAITCLFAATVGLAQNDIKRVIAYSTCSQLGYMFFAAGLGVYQAAMFHLFTHAFFKALLFLSAGSVINAMHHEQDMRYYGGLWKKIPITFAVMVIGTLAITGVGLEGVFGFAGFYSKDAIIASALASGTEVGGFAWFVGVFAALLTSFYSWRLIFLTFFGKPRWAASEHIQHAAHAHHDHGHDDHAHDAHHAEPEAEDAGHEPKPDTRGFTEVEHGELGYHPHESPWTMGVPLVVLSVGAVLAGWAFAPTFLTGEFWQGSVAYNEHLHEAAEHIGAWGWAPTIAMLIGLTIAWSAYIRDTSIPGRFTATFRGLYVFLLRKWYFDELYDLIFVRPAFAIGRFFWHKGDEGTIDRFGPDGIAKLMVVGNRITARAQSGYVYTYALVMLLGLAGVATWAMTR